MDKSRFSFLLSVGLAIAGSAIDLPANAATLANSWVSEALEAVKYNPKIGPTGASRAYGILGTAMYDAWSAYELTPISTQLGDNLQRPGSENTLANKETAISYAAYRVLAELFPNRIDSLNARMSNLGFDPNNLTTDTTTAVGIGNVMADALMQLRRYDGSNQLGGYVDTSGYSPINNRPENVIDIERWTPEYISDEASAPLQQYLTPHWGEVIPFALASGNEFRPPAPEPFLLVEGATVDLAAKTITLQDGSQVNIDRSLIGTIINPGFIQQAQELIDISANLTDKQKLIAEFWEDPAGTPFPPGHWMYFGQLVSQQRNHTLDDDIQMFFALGNAVMDAGIATWEAKGFYDYTRPVRAIRELGRLGLIGTDDGTGTFCIEAWGGAGKGTVTMPATEFITYQTPGSHPSPPFAEYTSGHSAFSSASAEILKLFTGSDAFGASVTFYPGTSRFEPGITPNDTVTLSWATFTEAAEEAGMSRLYGGIHFSDGNIQSQIMGQKVGAKVWQRTQFYINGGVTVPEPATTTALLILGWLSLAGARKCRQQ
ncbi:phosphoesterase [Hydrococcus rivularis NIES-593]|uniref:Phosphoesterase n=2 Tax=Hydrococcus TaxID=1616833 RepID=A0A1U7HTB9_9CYAN|nr:phosphoesterase [Hydrococcus rivularis NIES-593]